MSKQIISVIGSGRSGTHLLGYVLETSNKVTASIEDGELFPKITKAATRNDKTSIKEISAILSERLEGCSTDIYLEKSHPLLWFANDSLISSLPIKFIGIRRDPFATVSSMLVHNGVRKWCEQWKSLPQPNIFLGTRIDSIEEYSSMSIAQKCTMRWISHTKELERLRYLLSPDQYQLICYEDLISSSNKTIKVIEGFVGIKDIDKNFKFNSESLHKWKTEISPEQTREIAEVLNKHYKDSEGEAGYKV